MADQIHIVPHASLDYAKWDTAVRRDPVGKIYATSAFLNLMADDWYGLVVEDYRAVMALPVKKFAGMRMVYMPVFAQTLGLLGDHDTALMQPVANAIRKFTYLITYSSAEEHLLPGARSRRRTNFILPLSSAYETLAESFTAECRKNINKARNRGCTWLTDVSFDDVLELYQNAYGKLAAYKPRHFERLRLLLQTLPPEQVFTAGIANEQGELVYAGLLLNDGKRLYYLLGAPSPRGREMRATYFFINEIIRRFSCTGMTFDFEGSDIPDVARFYKGFGPVEMPYYQYWDNRLLFPLNKVADRLLAPF